MSAYIMDPNDPPYCATCRRALEVANGTPRHTGDADHPLDLKLRSQVEDPILVCDFCGNEGACWSYHFPDSRVDSYYNITGTVIGIGEHRAKNYNARPSRLIRGDGTTGLWGDTWAACDGCAEPIDAGDTLALVGRVCDSLPAKLRRPNKIAQARAELLRTYEPMLAGPHSERTRIIVRTARQDSAQ